MKKYLLGIFAIVLAIGFSAFTASKTTPQKLAGEKWFVFNGISPGDVNTPSKYSMDGNGSSPNVCDNPTLSYRCEILAVPQSGNPLLPDLATIIYETKRATP